MIKLNNINIEALRNSKLFKKVVFISIPIACIMVITNCSKKSSKENLSNTVIAYVNGEVRALKDITNEYPYCNDSKYLALNLQHEHYQDILTGELLTSGSNIECHNISKCSLGFSNKEVTNANIKKQVTITDFLTEEEKEAMDKDNYKEETKEEIIRNAIKEYQEYQSQLEKNKPNVLNLIHKN